MKNLNLITVVKDYIILRKDKKGDSPKFADEITQDEKTKSFENSHRCHVQSNVSLVMIQIAVVVL